MKNLFYSTLICVLLISCATLPSKNIPQEYNSNEKNGMIIGAIAIKNEKPIFNGYMFYYTGPDIDKISVNKMIRISPEQTLKMKFKPDFFDNSKAVYYFSIEEAEGQYSFSNLRLFENGGLYNSTANIPINIVFDIEPGKVKYIGEIFVDYKKSIITLNDKRDRDLKKLAEKFPNLKIE